MITLHTSLLKAALYYYEDCAAREQSPRTIEGKRCSIDAFIRWCLPRNIKALEDVDNLVLEDYRQYVSQCRRIYDNKLLDRSTKRNRLTAVMVFFRRIFQVHKLVGNPAEGFELPSTPKRLPKGILSMQEVQALTFQANAFAFLKYRDTAILEVYWATGMRRKELGGLMLGDIDFIENTVRINQGKGNKDRIIPISPTACVRIKDYIERERPKQIGFHSPQSLFLNNRGEAFTDKQLTALVNKYKRRAGITKPGACNLYRHTTATMMLENGADIRVIQEQLGHADLSTTQIYTQVSIRSLKDVYTRTHPANFS